MTKYIYPNDVEAAMDRFAEDNPGADWREVVRAFVQARRRMMKREVCGDCGVKEGRLHIPGCDMERCASCGGQSICCECTDEEWERTSTKERVSFIPYPNLCAKCGTLWPEMFMVPDEEWERYIEPRMRQEMLCKACYKQIKEWIDGR